MYSIRNNKTISEVLAELGIVGYEARKLQTQLSAYLRQCNYLRNNSVRVDDNQLFRSAADFLSWQWCYQPRLQCLSRNLGHNTVVDVLARVLGRQEMNNIPQNTRHHVAALSKPSQLHPMAVAPVPDSTPDSVSSVHPVSQTQYHGGPQRCVTYGNSDDTGSSTSEGQVVRPSYGSEDHGRALSSSLGKRAADEVPDSSVKRVQWSPHSGSSITQKSPLFQAEAEWIRALKVHVSHWRLTKSRLEDIRLEPIQHLGFEDLSSNAGASAYLHLMCREVRFKLITGSYGTENAWSMIKLKFPMDQNLLSNESIFRVVCPKSPTRASFRYRPLKPKDAHTETTSKVHQLVSTDDHPKPAGTDADSRRHRISSDHHLTEPTTGFEAGHYSGPSSSLSTQPRLVKKRTHAASNHASYKSDRRSANERPVTDEVGRINTEEEGDTITVLVAPQIVDLTVTDSSMELDGLDDDATTGIVETACQQSPASRKVRPPLDDRRSQVAHMGHLPVGTAPGSASEPLKTPEPMPSRLSGPVDVPDSSKPLAQSSISNNVIPAQCQSSPAGILPQKPFSFGEPSYSRLSSNAPLDRAMHNTPFQIGSLASKSVASSFAVVSPATQVDRLTHAQNQATPTEDSLQPLRTNQIPHSRCTDENHSYLDDAHRVSRRIARNLGDLISHQKQDLMIKLRKEEFKYTRRKDNLCTEEHTRYHTERAERSTQQASLHQMIEVFDALASGKVVLPEH